MPTIRDIITKEHMRQAEEAAASRQYTSRDPLIYADERELGLSIRVQGGSARWVLKYSGSTRVLGSLSEITSPTAARALAVETREVMRSGVGDDARRFVRQRRSGKTTEEAVAVLARQRAHADGKWRWEDLARRYPDEYLSRPRKTARGMRMPSAASAAEARRYLNDPVVIEHLGGRLLMELTRGDFERVRDTLLDVHGRKTASRQFVSYSSAAMSWARRYFGGASGLEGVDRWWVDTIKRDETLPTPKARMPEIDDLARTLYLAETTRVMPGRRIQKGTSEVVLCALWWIAITALRAHAAVSVRRSHIVPWRDAPEPGWVIASFRVEDMKGKRFFALPIPPRAALLLERVGFVADPESEFVFPAQRRRKADGDVPISRSSPRLLLERLRGRPANPSMSREDEIRRGQDLLDGIEHFSTHDLRRTFATVCSDLAVRGDAISAVLDHADGSAAAPSMTATPTRAEVTRMVYDHSQRLALKAIAMSAWCDALFSACDREWSRHRTAVRRPLPRRSGEPYPDRPEFRPDVPWYRTIERWHAGRPKAPTSLGLAAARARRQAEEDEPEDA